LKEHRVPVALVERVKEVVRHDPEPHVAKRTSASCSKRRGPQSRWRASSRHVVSRWPERCLTDRERRRAPTPRRASSVLAQRNHDAAPHDAPQPCTRVASIERRDGHAYDEAVDGVVNVVDA
jgi:hypothetical protein